MRDDLSALFSKLLLLYKEKLRQLEIIAINEIQLRYFVHSENYTSFSDLLKNDNILFEKLDSIEFDIKSLTENICRISGIDKNKFNIFFLNRKEYPIPEIKKLKDNTDKKISDIIKERDKLIIEMEGKLAETAIDINTIKKVRKLFGSTESCNK